MINTKETDRTVPWPAVLLAVCILAVPLAPLFLTIASTGDIAETLAIVFAGTTLAAAGAGLWAVFRSIRLAHELTTLSAVRSQAVTAIRRSAEENAHALLRGSNQGLHFRRIGAARAKCDSPPGRTRIS